MRIGLELIGSFAIVAGICMTVGWAAYEALRHDARETQLWNEFKPAWDDWRRINSTAAAQLSTKAEQLQAMVGKFKLAGPAAA